MIFSCYKLYKLLTWQKRKNNVTMFFFLENDSRNSLKQTLTARKLNSSLLGGVVGLVARIRSPEQRVAVWVKMRHMRLLPVTTTTTKTTKATTTPIIIIIIIIVVIAIHTLQNQ